jgi:tape measure domain-containing protein
MSVDILNGGLSFGSSLDPSGFLAGAKRIEESNARLIAALEATANKSKQTNDKLKDSAKEAAGGFSTLEKSIFAAFTVGAITGFVGKVIEVRGEFQKLSSAFRTMLGSKEKADKLLAEATKLAATTPFSLQEVATGAKQLLAYGFAADTITKNLTDLGNIAAGVNAPLGDIVYLYGTLRASGRVTQLDINQFAGRGIPIYEELAKVMGVTTDRVRGLVSSGKIGFPEVERAFQGMTGEGGKFFNLMEEQSKSLSGQVSNLGDAFDMMINDIGASSEGALSGGIQGAISLVENYKEILEIIGVLIGVYGTYKAAVIVATAAQAFQATGLTLLEAAEVRLLAIQTALNKSMLANPYVLAATALAALVGAMILFADSSSTAEKAQKKLNAENEAFIKLAEDRKQKYEQLSAAIRDTNTTEFESNRLFKELQTLYPELFKNLTKEQFLKKSLADTQKEVNKANDNTKIGNLGGQAQEAQKEVERLTKSLQNYNDTRAALGNQGAGLISKSDLEENLAGARVEAERLTAEYKKQKQELDFANLSDEQKLNFLEDQVKQIEAQKTKTAELSKLSGGLKNILADLSIENLNLQLTQAQNKIKTLKGAAAPTGPRNIAAIDLEIENLKKKEGSVINHSEHLDYQKKLNKLQAERNAITGEGSKAQAKTVKIQENFEEKKIDLINKIAEAEASAAAGYLGRNEKEIADNKAKYQTMLDDIKAFNKKAPAGKKVGPEVVERVTKLANTEEASILFRQGTEQQAIEFERQKQLYAEYEQYKTDFGAEAAKTRFGNEVKTNADLLKELKVKAEELTIVPETDRNANQKDRLVQLQAQIKGIEALEQKRFADALKAAETSEQKINAVYVDFAQKKLDLLAATNGKATDEQLAILEKGKNAAISSIAANELMTSDIWTNLFSDLDSLTVAQIDTLIKQIEAQFSTLSVKFNPIDIKAVQDKLQEAREAIIKTNPFAAVGTAISAVFSRGADGAKKSTEEIKRDFNNLGKATEGAFKFVEDAIGSAEFLKDAIGEVGATAISSLSTIAVVSISVAAAIKTAEKASVILAIVQAAIVVVQAVLSVIKSVIAANDKRIDRQIDGYKAQLASLQDAFAALDRAVQNSVGESIYTDQAKQIENLKKQQAELIKARDAESKKKKADQGKIDEYNKQIADIPNQIADIEKAISENIIQGSFKDLANSLADSLVDAFKTGENSIEAMDKSFNAFIGNAIKNSLKLKLLEPIIKALTDDLVDYAKNNNNSIIGFDFAAYKDKLKAAGAVFTDALEANKEFFEDAAGGASKNTLSKGIQGITETTANRLEGEFGGLRLAQLQLLSVTTTNHGQLLAIHTQKLSALIQIEINTRGTKDNTDHLQPIRTALESIDKKTSDAKLRGAGIGP